MTLAFKRGNIHGTKLSRKITVSYEFSIPIVTAQLRSRALIEIHAFEHVLKRTRIFLDFQKHLPRGKFCDQSK